MRRAFALLSHLALVPLVSAQTKPPAGAPTLVWATAGAGAGSEGFAASIGADVLAGHHLFSVRAAATSEFLGDGYWDYGLLYGRARRTTHGLMALSAGIAVVNADVRCGHTLGTLGVCSHVRGRIGFPVAGRVDWNPLPMLGLGAYAFADFNGEKPFGGVVLAVNLGRLSSSSP